MILIINFMQKGKHNFLYKFIISYTFNLLEKKNNNILFGILKSTIFFFIHYNIIISENLNLTI